MNEIAKLVSRVSKVDKARIENAIKLIYENDLPSLDLKKIKGADNEFRVRVGKYRIKFIKHKTMNEITEVVRRGDNTY